MEAGRPVSGALELAVGEPPDDEAQSRLIGVLSPTMTGNAINKILASSSSTKGAGGMLRTCDFDMVGGPLELEEAEWDGVSVWIGGIPRLGVCRRDGAKDDDASRTAANTHASTGIFHRLYKLTDSLEQELNAVGAGIEPDDAGLRAVCVREPDSWALVTFKRREDAETMLRQGLSITTGSDDARAPLLLKRAICANEARQQLEEAAQAAKEKYEMVLLAVSRIQSWVKRSGKQLVDLFTTIDADGSGEFNVQEFRAGMLSIGLTFTDEVIDALMQQMDKDGDGEVDVTEFIAKMDKFANELNESSSSILGALARYMDASGATVASIFAANDKDLSGHLNVDEFHHALLAIGIQQSERSARETLKELDVDGDGNMTLTELTAHLSEHRRKRRAFAAKILSEIFDFINKTNASATRIFARVDSDGSGDLDVLEFQEALSRMGQDLTPDQVHEIMAELDLDHSGTIAVSEFLDKLKQAESERRADMRKCKKLFEEADKDGDGVLDLEEIVWVGEQMGLGEQMQSQAFVEHMIAEMNAGDLLKDHTVKADGSISPKAGSPRARGTREPNALRPDEAMRTLHVGNIEPGTELESDAKLTSLFEMYGEVSSVTLRRKAAPKKSWALVTFTHQDNAKALAQSLVSGNGLAYDLLIEKHQLRIKELDRGKQAQSTGAMAGVTSEHQCKLGYTQFIAWFLEIGKSYLDKPHYEAKPMLVAPPDEELQDLFKHVDADNSGEADLAEVQEALYHIWPYLDSTGFYRAFQAADTDNSGHVDYSEFKNLVEFIIWLNNRRHFVEELQHAFGTHVGEAEFYFGCQNLNIAVTDGKARYLFQELCEKCAVAPNERGVREIGFDQFIIWAARYCCITLKFGAPPETESQRLARQRAEMSKELENLAGEYGDIHFIDLVNVVSKKRSTSPTDGSDSLSTKSKFRSALKRSTTSVLECSELVKKGIEFSTKKNDSFPNFNDDSLRMMVRMCTKEEYFTGQNIITEGEIDSRYYVLRRGRVDVIVADDSEPDEDGVNSNLGTVERVPREIKVTSLEWGMGFGEIGLLLATKRTATIRASTPCEVYCLDRPGYETVLALLPEDQRLGPMAKALNNFWQLMTGPDGSRRECVDFKTYLKSHVRTSKTLMTASDMDEFDEDEERAIAQSDWEEDCARYKMKVTGSLSKSQYFDAMYQLVYLWSEDQQLSYANFLSWVFENIAEWDEERKAFMFRKLEQVECVGDKFEKMKEEARDLKAAQEQAAAEVLAAAEAARAAHVAQLEREEKLRAEQQRLEDEQATLKEEQANLQAKLSSLDNEEAELLQRLQRGELSPEEEAAVRARLAEIGNERAELQRRLYAIADGLEAQLASEIQRIDDQLTALADEEAELLRRLESGALTAEEEAKIRARLKVIDEQRQALMKQRQQKLLAQEKAKEEASQYMAAAELAELNNQLSALDDEEAELLRRLQSGELSPEEERAVRARLNDIARERATLQARKEQQRIDAELEQLVSALTALDDEEAELMRRLARGDLTPEEEEEVRSRLAAIEAERRRLKQRQNELHQVEENLLLQLAALGNLSAEALQRVKSRLAALDALMKPLREAEQAAKTAAKEAQILGSPFADLSSMSPQEIQQWKAERDLRRAQELAEADQAARISTPQLTTAPRQWGSGAHALATAAQARREWSACATTQACREQRWAELDASRLPPKLLSEWHQLRSTLRKSGQAGRGRALAWLSKALRELDIIDNREAALDMDNANGCSSTQGSQIRVSVDRSTTFSNFPAPFVPRSSLVKSPRQRQRQRQRDKEMLCASGADSVLFASVSSPQLGLDAASGLFTSSFHTSPMPLDEQESIQLQLGVTTATGIPRCRSVSPRGTDGHRDLQLGAAQFDMADKLAGGTFRVCTASYAELGVGAVPAPLLRGPYMEWEAPDSPYRTQSLEHFGACRSAYSLLRTRLFVGAGRRRNRAGRNASPETRTARWHSPSKVTRCSEPAASRGGTLPALKSPVVIHGTPASDRGSDRDRDRDSRQSFTHIPTPAPVKLPVHWRSAALDFFQSFGGSERQAERERRRERHNETGSSGFSFEGAGRRSPPRPTGDLLDIKKARFLEETIGTTVRL